MNETVILRAYKITHDTGFAPNPYGGILTLATCKPGIRQKAKVGEWVAAFTAKNLANVPIGQEGLIYLMKVSKKMTFEQYYDQYPDKRPENCVSGDNIYRLVNGEYEQIPNKYHDEDEKCRDLTSDCVLLADTFYYFGKEAMPIPSEYRPNMPKGQAKYGYITEGEQAQRFIDWVINYAKKHFDVPAGMLGQPHQG